MFHYNTNTDNETTLIQRRKKESVSSFIGEIKQLSPRTVFLTQLKCGWSVLVQTFAYTQICILRIKIVGGE